MTDTNPLVHRRQALGAAAAGALATALARPASSRAASASNLYVVVDAAGGGDYTDLETAVGAVTAGHTIFVKAGLYQIQKGNMRPAQGVRIIGEGWGTHIQGANGLNSNLFVAEYNDIMFESLRIDGNGANQKLASGNCIYFGGCAGGGVRGCWVQSSPGYNIVCFPGATQVVIANNFVFDGLEEGIELQGASSCSVVGNVISNHRENGIYLWNSSGDCSFNAVVGNTVSGSTEWHGIQVTAGAHDNTISANTVLDNAQYGIVCNACGPNVVSANVVRGNGSGGIFVTGSSNGSIVSNQCEGNVQDGIYVSACEGFSVVGNNCYNNQGNGIEIGTYDPYAVNGGSCSGNVCANNGQGTDQTRKDGIQIRGPYTGILVNGNRCYDSQSPQTQLNGIAITDGYAKEVVLSANSVADNAGPGLAVAADALANVTVVPQHSLSVAVGTMEVAVPHGLSYPPYTISISMTSPGGVWRSAPSDETNIYLTADAADRSADVLVG